MEITDRTFVGATRFLDIELGQMGEFHVFSLDSRFVALFLEQDVLGTTGIGGDCEIGFDRVKLEELLRIFAAAVSVAEAARSPDWQLIGSMTYSWFDQDEQGDSPGAVLVEARPNTIRLILRPSPKQERADYVATMPSKEFRELVLRVREAMMH